jgi:ribosome-binding protein aMBF1 (putative translation factor)
MDSPESSAIYKGQLVNIKSLNLNTGETMKYIKHTAKMIKKLRTESGLSAYKLAKQNKMTASHIHFIEKGETSQNVRTLIKLAKFFKVSLTEIVGI